MNLIVLIPDHCQLSFYIGVIDLARETGKKNHLGSN